MSKAQATGYRRPLRRLKSMVALAGSRVVRDPREGREEERLAGHERVLVVNEEPGGVVRVWRSTAIRGGHWRIAAGDLLGEHEVGR